MLTKHRRRLMRHAGPPVRGARPQLGKADMKEKPELAPAVGTAAKVPAAAAKTAPVDAAPPHDKLAAEPKAAAVHPGNALATRSAVKSALAGRPDNAAAPAPASKADDRLGAVNLHRRAEG